MQRKICSFKMAYICLGVLGALLLLRAFFGVDYTDESFYFALAKRFYQGDKILIDEWFPTQLIGVLLLPFYRIYVWLHGNQEGIILCARLCYVLFSVLTAEYMLSVFQKEGRSCGYSLLVSAFFCIYVRASIGTFSYYSLGLLSFLLFLLFLIDAKHTKRPEWKWILSGINFSISVICMPYLVLFFLIMVLLYLYRRKSLLPGREGVFFILGILIVCILFFQGVGSSIFLGFKNIPEILMDPQHQGSIGEKLISFLIYMCFTYLKFTWPLYVLTMAAGFYSYKKKIQNQRWMLFYRGVVYLEFFVQAAYVRTFFEGGIVFAVLLLAIQLWLIQPSIGNRNTERMFLVAGLGFGLIWILGSNVGIRVFNMGTLLADVWAIQVLYEDTKKGARLFRYLRNGVVVLLLGVLLLNRFLDVYRDSAIWNLDTQITKGSMKYLFTTEKRATEYELAVEELAQYTTEEDRLAVPGANSWLYLDAPALCGAYSVWKVDFTEERNWSYYEKVPENNPSVVYLLDASYGSYTAWKYSSHGSNRKGNEGVVIEGYLEELIQKQMKKPIAGKTGIFYR